MKRWIALLIGVATISAGVLTWRGGQIGSSASFNDRQSVGEQVDLDNAEVDVTIEAARQARQYDRYLAEYAVADGLDNDAEQLRTAGKPELADLAARQADQRRQAAETRANDAGVFGSLTLSDPHSAAPTTPGCSTFRSVHELRVLETTSLGSSGDLQPQKWADKSDRIRVRIRNLTYWVGLLLIAVVTLTAAEVTVSQRLRRSGLVFGVVCIGTAWIGALATGFAT